MKDLDKKKALELLNDLFDASKTCEEEWNDTTYILADMIRYIDKPSELAIRELYTAEVIDTISNTYKIPRNITQSYVAKDVEFVDNLMDQLDRAAMEEVENWIGSVNILSYQNSKEF